MKDFYVNENNLPKQECPVCQAVLDSASGEAAVPSEGAITIFVFCRSVLTFTKDLHMREMTDEEFSSLPSEVVNTIIDFQLAMKEADKEVGKPLP